VAVEGGVMEFAQRKAVGNHRLSLWIVVRQNVGRVQQFPVVKQVTEFSQNHIFRNWSPMP